MKVIRNVYSQIQAVLHHGDRRYNEDVIVARYDDLELFFMVELWRSPQQRIWYSELEDVLEGVRMKVTREGPKLVFCTYSRESDVDLVLGKAILRAD